MTTYRITRHREEVVGPIQAFMRAHGIDPNDVPLYGDIEIDEGGRTLTVDRYVRNDAGQIISAGEDGKRESVTVDLVAPWPFPPEVTEL